MQACWPLRLSRGGQRTCAAWLAAIAGILLATSAAAQPWQRRDPLADGALPLGGPVHKRPAPSP